LFILSVAYFLLKPRRTTAKFCTQYMYCVLCL